MKNIESLVLLSDAELVSITGGELPISYSSTSQMGHSAAKSVNEFVANAKSFINGFIDGWNSVK